MKKVIAILTIIVIAGVAIGIYVTKHSSSPKSSTTPSSTTAATTPSQNNPSTNKAVLITKTDANVGKYLATSDGQALYTYNADTKNTSNCAGSCLADWPAYQATSTADLPANVATIKRPDNGQTQYTYKGLPLYTFIGDSADKVTGNNVENFQVAKP